MDKNHHWCFLKIKTQRSYLRFGEELRNLLSWSFFFFLNWERNHTYRNVYQNRLVKSKYSNILELKINTESTPIALTIMISLLLWQSLFYIFWSFVKIISYYICFLDAASITEHLTRDFSMWSHVTVVYSFHCCKVFHYMITPQWSSLLLLGN